jgi:hypothetical protein
MRGEKKRAQKNRPGHGRFFVSGVRQVASGLGPPQNSGDCR